MEIEDFKILIDNFFNENKKTNIYLLFELNKLLKDLDLSKDIIDYYNILNKNKTFVSLIDYFIKNNQRAIVLNGLDSYKFCNLLVSFILFYCDEKNIDLKNLNETNSDDSKDIYFNDMNGYSQLSKEEEYNLFKEYETTHDIRIKNKIASCNLRLVVSIAKIYSHNGVYEYPDVIQEGNIGLLDAIDKFDVNMGYRFSTYATWWIRQSIQRGIMQNSSTIKKGIHFNEKIIKYKKVKSFLYDKLNREPSNEEIADEMGVSVNCVLDIIKYNYELISLSSTINNETNTELIEFIPNENVSIEEEYEEKEKVEVVWNLIHNINLNKREQEVLILRYGLFNNYTHTLDQIGKKYGVTRERIRQIEAKALRKLRNYCNSKLNQNKKYDLRLFYK